MAEKAEKKTGKARKGLTQEQLKSMGKRGHLVLLARLAYGLGSQNKFSGTKWAGRTPEAVAGTFYQKVGPKGAVLTLAEDSDATKASLSAAKAAQSDIAAAKWTGNAQKFLDAIISTTAGGSGTKTRNFGIASDLKF